MKAKLRNGVPCFGAQIGLCDPAVAEIFGRAGFDWLVVDMEHSANSMETLRAMLQAAAHTDAVMLGRPASLDPDRIRGFLDLGAQGILCPFINTGEEARMLVSACRYPPHGVRGYGPRRASAYGFDSDEYFQTANDALLCIPIIEAESAIDNIEEIVRVEGIDGVVIGPMDLSISLGAYAQFSAPRYLAAVERVRGACSTFGKAMGTGCYSLEQTKLCMDAKDLLLLIGGDDVFLASESRRWLKALKTD